MKRILVAVDGSEAAGRAAHFAAGLAERTGAILELLHVYDAPTAAHLGLRALSKEEIGQRGARIAQGSLQAAEAVIDRQTLRVEHHHAPGHPHTEIVVRAQETGAELIVVGSRGLGAIKGVLLGSVSRKVLERAPCPVTVVP